jgi:hypothetical protein
MPRAYPEVKADIHGCFRRGEHEMEAGYPYQNSLNELQRELIAAFARQHGEAWLGRINLYKEDKALPIIWKWDGGLVYNFGARFVIDHFDEELYNLIVLRFYAPYTGTMADFKRVDAIFTRLHELKGEILTWN